MYFNARFYDPGISEFTSPDTIIPNLYNPLDWNRYSYARYNPLKYTDPSGHDPSLNNCDYAGIGCKSSSGRGSGENGGGLSWNGYKQGWSNFNSALTAINNPNTPPLAKTYSAIYILAWGGAHVAVVAGGAGLACAASGPGCSTVVEGVLGIGAGISADGNPTNEIESVGSTVEIAQSKITYLLTSPGKASGFSKLGYSMTTLKSELQDIGHSITSSDLSDTTQWGVKFEKAVEVVGPSGLYGRITSVWQVDFGTTVTRLITAIPEVFK
jgi:hypothetical protein